jgi:2-aminoadipate transaminase
VTQKIRKVREGEIEGMVERAVGQVVLSLEANVLREIIKDSNKPGVVSLAGGMPAEDLFDEVGLRAAAAAVMERPREALQYGVSPGNEALRKRICSLMAQRQAKSIGEHEIVITTGASQAIDLLGRTLLEPEDVIAVEQPTFLATLSVAHLCQAKVVEVPVDESGLRIDELERLLLEEHPIKVLYTMPTFSNPSGAVLPVDRRRRLLELAREHGVVVVEDDAYGSLWFDQPPPPSLLALSQQMEKPPLCVYTSTFSKIMAPGLRLGWVIAPAPLIERLTLVKQIADVHTSGLDQAIALEYLRSDRLDAHVERVRNGYAERAGWLIEAIRESLPEDLLEFDTPTGGMFLWCRLNDGTAEELRRRALDEGVTVVPGDPFFKEPPAEQYLRLSYSKLSEKDAKKAVRRLAVALNP